jgi:hypothetical protein
MDSLARNDVDATRNSSCLEPGSASSGISTPPVITDFDALLRRGIVSRVPITVDNDDRLSEAAWKQYASMYSVVTPEIMAGEADGEYAFYRNILEEPDFPKHAVLQGAIGDAIREYMGVASLSEIRLDDAFCIHYSMDQQDSRGAKHMDPSDITVNLCIDKSPDCRGSQVLFYGTKELHHPNVQQYCMTKNNDTGDGDNDNSYRFLVNQEPGYATIHWGNHPHETTKLESGHRTNIVITYCYVDPTKSDVSQRACYNV